jgi:arsenate reductase
MRQNTSAANRMLPVPVVLFLCTANRARSQIAEAILRHEAPDRFDVRSAGLRPASIHPLAIRVLEEIGIDTSPLRSKSIEEFFRNARVSCAIIVCEDAEELCPRLFPFCGRVLHWPFEDPVTSGGTESEQLAEFREIRDQISRRIRKWLCEEPLAIVR